MIVSASRISTLTEAYRGTELKAFAKAVYSPNATLNNKVSLWRGDITTLAVDGIQNAANSGLRGGSGINGAIQDAAGPQLLEACLVLGGCETGNTKITRGFNLPSKHVLHTVGPVYSSGKAVQHEQKLASCYRTTLYLAADNKLRTVALCGVSTGIYGFPLERAARIACETTRQVLDDRGDEFERIIFCNFSEKDEDMYAKTIPLYFPPVEDATVDDGENGT